jgi:hypothetical protein
VLPPKTMVSAEQKRRQAFFGSDYPTMHDTELQKVKDIPSALNRQQSHKGVPVINGGPPNKPKPGVAEYLYMRDRARSEQR